MQLNSKVGDKHYTFKNLKDLLAKASPLRSADQLSGVAAESEVERIAAQKCLAAVELKDFIEYPLIDPDQDEVSELIYSRHCTETFNKISNYTIGELRDYLISPQWGQQKIVAISPGLTPEMIAAVSKLMRNQDLIHVAAKLEVVSKFRSTIGLKGHLSTRIQPNHPTDHPLGIGLSILDGLLLGNGDALIGINPATDIPSQVELLTRLLDNVISENQIPTQSCVLAHCTTQMAAIELGAPIDLMFQSIAGTEGANKGFGISLALLKEAQDAALSLKRNIYQQVMYFETGQGSCLSAGCDFGVDSQTLEARAYAVAKEFNPFLVNTVVGFIGPEYLYGGKQIIRAGLEDHFSGKMMGLPMGCDICYTLHNHADFDDLDNLLFLLSNAGCNFIMGVPGHDDIMLNYVSTSYQDARVIREVLGLKHAPEFDTWLQMQKSSEQSELQFVNTSRQGGLLLGKVR